jgi:alanine-synthesizing transaminase
MLFAKRLIEEAGVAVAPGVGFGEYGEGFVRIGLVENEHRIRQAARNVKRFLDGPSVGSDAAEAVDAA